MSGTKQTKVTVIIPLPDHRGIAPEVADRWVNHVQFDQKSFEIIFISDGKNTTLDKRIIDSLRPIDKFIVEPKANLLELANVGVRNASSELVFITESHCIPYHDCLTELCNYFATHDVALACCKSDGINKTVLAEMEQRIFDEDFERRSKEDSWNKITVRGFGILRSVFLKENGFLSQFEHFAEPALGAHLHFKGYKMGFADKVMVSHFNNPSLKYLIPGLKSYGKSMAMYFAEGNKEYASKYFKADLTRYRKVYHLRKVEIITHYWRLHQELERTKKLIEKGSLSKMDLYQKYQSLWACCIHLGECLHIIKTRVRRWMGMRVSLTNQKQKG
ncbi:MAG: glycosyltransferase [Cyclobacteriaceae bacterium]